MKDKIREIVENIPHGFDSEEVTEKIYQSTRLDIDKVRSKIEDIVYFPMNDGTSDYIGDAAKAICLQQDELTKEG